MGFFQDAIGTTRQKLFWAIFGAVLGVILIAIIAVTAPRTVRITTHLQAGEWAHVRPEHIWHSSATYTFTTVPAEGATAPARTLPEATAHVYDTARYGEVYEYAMNSGKQSLVLGLESTNWNTSLYMTQGSTLAISTLNTPTPLDLVASNNHATFKRWLEDGTIVHKEHIIHSLINFHEISAAIQITPPTVHLASERVYVGIKVNPESTRKERITVEYYQHVAGVPLANSTNATGHSIAVPFSARTIVQIDAPAECTSADVAGCVLTATLEARWGLYVLGFVLPCVIVAALVMLGLMALKALHTRQMLEAAAKRTEEGVALESAQPRDIHAEKLEEAADAPEDAAVPEPAAAEGGAAVITLADEDAAEPTDA